MKIRTNISVTEEDIANGQPRDDMMQPCKECPFRRDSAPGWLGGHKSSLEITDIVEADHRFPCHTKVNQIMERSGLDFECVVDDAPVCVGSLIYLNNRIKLSRNPEMMTLQRTVAKSDEIFKSAQEMNEHHIRGNHGRHNRRHKRTRKRNRT